MGRVQEPEAVRQCAAHLRDLLLRKQYHQRWRRQTVDRERHGRVHQRAVATVLAQHLDSPAGAAYPELSVQSLPQLVSKALRGERLSRRTLQFFIDAFAITEVDARRLWRLFEGTERIRVLSDTDVVPPETSAAIGPRRHRTKSVQEHHYLGPDGMPERHRTHQVIEAIVDGLDRIPYCADSNALTVEVEEGGRLVGPLRRLAGDLHTVDIALDTPLALGDATALVYVTHFHYTVPPPTEFRRAVRHRVENVGLRVQFHPDMRPRRIFWGVWDGLDGPLIEREPVEPREPGYVYRYLELIENTVVGFTWEW